MELLAAINLCLKHSQLGTIAQITQSSNDSAIAKNTLETVRRRILAIGFDFNTQFITLNVDANDKVPIPSGYLSVEFPYTDEGKLLSRKIDVSDGGLKVWHVENNDWHDEAIEDVKVVYDINDSNFQHIPEEFAQWIAYEAASEFYQERKGMPNQYLIQQSQLNAAKAVNGQPPRDHYIPVGARKRWAAFSRYESRTDTVE